MECQVGDTHMHIGSNRIYEKTVDWILVAGVVGFIAFDTWIHRAALLPVLSDTLAFGVGAAIAAWCASGSGAVRLSLTFALASLVLLPPPAPLLVALAACAGGRGAGVAGLDRRGGTFAFAVLVPIAAAQFLYRSAVPLPTPLDATALLHLALLFIVIQAFSTGLGVVLSAMRDPRSSAVLPEPSRIAGEMVNAPLAWLLASMTIAASPLTAFLFGGLVLGLQVGFRELHRARTHLAETHDSLSARVTELATLHAIGREILSSLDPERVFVIVDRECRKILELDSLIIAIADRDTRQIKVAYSRRRGVKPDSPPPALGNGLAAWVVREKRALRIDDLQEGGVAVPRAADKLDSETRSVLAVPLIVEDEAIGVILVQSRIPGVYDDHLLSVLTTIAQQAAVAIENARHYEMATVDSLTGLFLRPYFFRRLEEEHKRAKRYKGSFGLLMMDLDGFKAINDRYGHLVGDRYLRAVGAIVQSRLRGPDLACRYGGDEICLLLPETDLDGAQAIAERIRSAVGGLVVHVDALAIRTTTSIGVAAFPDHAGEDLKLLLRKADEALYAAKKSGRDRVVPSAA